MLLYIVTTFSILHYEKTIMDENIEEEEELRTEILFEAPKEVESSEDPPMSEWSSLEESPEAVNPKRIRAKKGLYHPGSGEICTKYMQLSDSSVFRHSYYKYPAVLDPGITAALMDPEPAIIYPDDGQDLYKNLCAKLKTSIVRIFHDNLINEKINLSYYCVNHKGVIAMAAALQHNKYVRELNLTDNFLNDDACYHLGQMLKSNITLEDLNLTGCRIRASGMRRLGHQLPINRSLKSLNLARNCLEDEGGEIFAKYIDEGTDVERVNLSDNKLGIKTALELANAWEYKHRITHLDLSSNTFYHVPSLLKMLEMLSKSQILQELNLAWNAFEGERLAAVIKNILLIPTLTILDLSNNRLKDNPVMIITDNLAKAKNLKTFDLSSNPLSPLGAYHVINKMLRPQVKLNNLYLHNICVKNNFLMTLQSVQKMKSRKNFVVTYGEVLENWTISGPDSRELILKRAEYLGNQKKSKVDVISYLLRLSKMFGKPVVTKDLTTQIDADGIPLNVDLVTELSYVFPGPKTAKTRSVNLKLIEEYIHRLWPDKKAPSLITLLAEPNQSTSNS